MIGRVHRLANPVQRYAWGSPSAIPEFLGEAPDGGPVAEVWMGAHPSAPSALLEGPEPGSGSAPLDAAVHAHPRELLGAEVQARWGARLPFLLKLLAAAAPLSLQVHPSAAQAEAGYAREEAAGTDRGAPTRTYRDPSHKPELLLALTPFRALCGFREPAASLGVLEGLALGGDPVLAAVLAALRRADPADAVRAAFDAAAAAGPQQLAAACEVLASASAARLARGSEHPEDDAWAVELQHAHPGDVGVLLSVLLHHVRLAPGQCLYVGPGQLHAHLSGLGVEAMACSDNVLRAGLTPKHVDLGQLRAVMTTTPTPLPLLEPRRSGHGVLTYQPPVDDVALDVVDLAAGAVLPPEAGPRILLALEGEAVLEVAGGARRAGGARAGVPLRRGESVFVPAGEVVGARGAARLAVGRVGRR